MLSLDDIPVSTNSRERAVELQQIAALAVAGGSGLALLLSEEVNDEIGKLLEQGKSFLGRVIQDVDHSQSGVKLEEATRLVYDPRSVFAAFAASAGTTPSTDSAADRLALASMQMRTLSSEVLIAMAEVGAMNKISTDEIVSLVQKYRQVSAPYLVVASEASDEFKRGGFPRIFKTPTS
jgi:hypothetical protein